jgi:hypothetical protein
VNIGCLQYLLDGDGHPIDAVGRFIGCPRSRKNSLTSRRWRLRLLGLNNVAKEDGALRPHEGNFKSRPIKQDKPPVMSAPSSKGDGNMTYLCDDCETALLETVDYKLVRDLVVICKKCGCYNDIPPDHHEH